MIENPRRNELSGIPFLNLAFDHITARWNVIFGKEHNQEGHHTDITATSITIGTRTGEGVFTPVLILTNEGEITAPGDTHTLGEFVFESGSSVTGERVTIGGTTDGWRIGRGAASSPLNGTWALEITDMASPNFPVAEIGTIAGVYHLLPHDSAQLALGYQAGSSGDRLKSVSVLDGVYEGSQTVANGHRQTLAYADANFSGEITGNADWVVDDADEVVSYSRNGDAVTVNWNIITTTVANSPTQLRISGVPTAAVQCNARGNVTNGGVLFSVNVFISAGTAIIGMAKDDGSAFTNETNLTGASGQITYWV